jgi:hypothetical protein
MTKYMCLYLRTKLYPFTITECTERTLLPMFLWASRKMVLDEYDIEIFEKILENAPEYIKITKDTAKIYYPINFNIMQLFLLIKSKLPELVQVMQYRKSGISFKIKQESFNQLKELPMEVLMQRIKDKKPFDDLYEESK